jgi:acyl-CoA thioesterase FadM
VTFGYEVNIAESGVLCATAQSDHICVTSDGRVTAWPADWKEWLTAGLLKTE